MRATPTARPPVAVAGAGRMYVSVSRNRSCDGHLHLQMHLLDQRYAVRDRGRPRRACGDQHRPGARYAGDTTVNWVGQRTPMHATSAGKVFMAHMDPEQLDALLEHGLETYTPHTIVDPAVLRREVALVRERGYASTADEHEIGLAAIAAPIRTLDGHVIAAVAASGPTFGINEDTVPDLVEHVLAAAAEISQRHGYPRRG